MTKLKIPLALLAVSFWALFMSGCANVNPREREFLADPIMELNEGVLSSLYEQHMHRALSQGLIGMPVGGGGCGCEQ